MLSVQSSVNPLAASAAPVLSVILPFFRKFGEFQRVLPLNLPYLERPDLEVVLVLDENTEERAVLALLEHCPGVRWKVIVNDVPHPWRPPCRAINVGLISATSEVAIFMVPRRNDFVNRYW